MPAGDGQRAVLAAEFAPYFRKEGEQKKVAGLIPGPKAKSFVEKPFRSKGDLLKPRLNRHRLCALFPMPANADFPHQREN
jgi:hypothetical protein